MTLIAALILSLLTVTLISPLQAGEDAGKLTLVHPGRDGSLYDISAQEFARRANAKLGGLYKVEVRASPQLGDGPALISKLMHGEADLVLPSAAMISVSDRFAIFELPFLIRNRTQIRALRGALLERYLQPEAERKGLFILGLWESGFRHLTNDVRAVTRPRHLKGMRIAVEANGWREKVWRAFGAEPVPMGASALPDALEASIVAGQEAPLDHTASNNYAGLQRYLTMSDHLYSPAFLVMRKARLEQLPSTARTVLAGEARAMERWIQDKAVALESDLVDRLDMTMQLNHADVKAFRSISRPVYGEFVRSVDRGAEMIEIVESLDVQAEAGVASR